MKHPLCGQHPISLTSADVENKKKKMQNVLPFSGAHFVPVSNWISWPVSCNCSRELFLVSLPLVGTPQWERVISLRSRARIATRDFAYVAANAAKNSTPVIAAEDVTGSFLLLLDARSCSKLLEILWIHASPFDHLPPGIIVEILRVNKTELPGLDCLFRCFKGAYILKFYARQSNYKMSSCLVASHSVVLRSFDSITLNKFQFTTAGTAVGAWTGLLPSLFAYPVDLSICSQPMLLVLHIIWLEYNFASGLEPSLDVLLVGSKLIAPGRFRMQGASLCCNIFIKIYCRGIKLYKFLLDI